MWEDLPRYLTAFSPRQLPHYFTDILVIGGGLAGLRAANASDLKVLVVTKDVIDQSSSNYAQGGIAGVVDPEDRFEEHVADTLNAGGNLCDEHIVDLVVREAPRHIDELIAWGTQFDRNDGDLSLGREGGHSHHRIVHALGDATGREVMRAVIKRTRAQSNIAIWENTFTLDLLTHEGECRGAVVSHPQRGDILVWAKQTILATGGGGQIYRESTNPAVATGDGHAMAIRANAELRDMEFVQFHPTLLYIAGSSRSLITEAMRGEGGRLIDHAGNRFMSEFDSRGELAPRDIVSRAIVTQMELTHHPCVYLDVSHLEAAFVLKRFPGIAAACKKFGVDITCEPIPVRPGAHYMIGGVSVDSEGRTTIPGLWAAGEVTSSGLHGANRLASNSLLEGLVYGVRTGVGAAAMASQMPDDYRVWPVESPPRNAVAEPLDLADIRNSLTSLMSRHVGVRRHGKSLQDAAQNIDRWRQYVRGWTFASPGGWELQNMLTVARLVVEGALQRQESRGVHFRTDFPHPDDEHWQRHLSFRIHDKSE